MNQDILYWKEKFDKLCIFHLELYKAIGVVLANATLVYRDDNREYDSNIIAKDTNEEMGDFLSRVSRIVEETNPESVFLVLTGNTKFTIVENEQPQEISGSMIVFVLQTPESHLFRAFPFEYTDDGLDVENKAYTKFGDISELEVLGIRLYPTKKYGVA